MTSRAAGRARLVKDRPTSGSAAIIGRRTAGRSPPRRRLIGREPRGGISSESEPVPPLPSRSRRTPSAARDALCQLSIQQGAFQDGSRDASCAHRSPVVALKVEHVEPTRVFLFVPDGKAPR
ncbi:Hypothetical protein NTJ_00415 [Nesidiocoris tenuis]|uniref:Uncharacterized protein n=1 Tax=Nesidiocoris tenuis TaxID=355587 RepID=A0ABN7A5Y1_9HEMI|nr:Hypothetical protein NTJ_00415 [Nesidiocoris tenuis]